MQLPLNTIVRGDARTVLRTFPDDSVQCVVTSPPYWGLRNYKTKPLVWGGDAACQHKWGKRRIVNKGRPGKKSTLGGTRNQGRSKKASDQGRFCKKCGAWKGEFGLEPTLQLFIDHLVEVFREIRRVLRPDGTLWLNMGDSFSSNHGGARRQTGMPRNRTRTQESICHSNSYRGDGIKYKDVMGMPWRVAFALQEDGWYFRCDCIWNKPNPMPESVQDRPTKAHEYVFIMSKSPRYFYDNAAVREPISAATIKRILQPSFDRQKGGPKDPKTGNRSMRRALVNVKDRLIAHKGWAERHGGYEDWDKGLGRNKRSVWTIATQPSREKHFATYPEDLVLPCVLAGTSDVGACAKCGAAVRRLVDVSYTNPGNRRTNGPRSTERKHQEHGSAGYSERREKVVSTKGWKRTCRCRASFVPCVVLDPFMGSGTTALVALKQRRNFVGIELNPKYIKIAEKRIWQEKHQSRMF